MTCLIKGCNFVLKNIPQEAFVYQKDADPEFRFQTNHPNIFPYLLVNIGSGVSIVKVRPGFRGEVGGGASGAMSSVMGAYPPYHPHRHPRVPASQSVTPPPGRDRGQVRVDRGQLHRRWHLLGARGSTHQDQGRGCGMALPTHCGGGGGLTLTLGRIGGLVAKWSLCWEALAHGLPLLATAPSQTAEGTPSLPPHHASAIPCRSSMNCCTWPPGASTPT